MSKFFIESSELSIQISDPFCTENAAKIVR